MINNPKLLIEAAPKQTHPVPGLAGNLISLVDRCWACNEVFPKYGGRIPQLVQEFHHIIPRAVGGVDGPTVSLCSGDHFLVHSTASNLKSGKTPEALKLLPRATVQGIMTLANHLLVSTSALQNDPNRRMKAGCSISLVESELLKKAAKSRGLTISEYVYRLIDASLRAEFPDRRNHR